MCYFEEDVVVLCSHRSIFVLGSTLMTPIFIAFPFLNHLNSGVVLWGLLLTGTILKSLITNIVFTVINIQINSAAPVQQRGAGIIKYSRLHSPSHKLMNSGKLTHYHFKPISKYYICPKIRVHWSTFGTPLFETP